MAPKQQAKGFGVEGVAWPEKSTTVVGKRVWGACARALGTDEGTALAEAMDSEKDWRHLYHKHLYQLGVLTMASTENAFTIAEAGLEALHKNMIFSRGDAASPGISVADAVRGEGVEVKAVETLTHVGTGSLPDQTEIAVPITVNKTRHMLRGDSINQQMEAWHSYGAAQSSCVESVKAVTALPQEELQSALSKRIFCLIGATSELCPCRPLLDMGATVVAIARPGRKLNDLVSYAQASPGTIIVPKVDGKVGMDLMLQTPEVGAWLLSLAESHSDKQLFCGSYIYLDGEANVRCSTAVDAVWSLLVDKLDHSRLEFGLLASPATAHIWPEECYQKAVQNWKERPWWTKMGGFTSSLDTVAHQPPGRRVMNGFITMMGPSYALAQTLRLWRCIVARRSGVVVSANFPPSCRTYSMTHVPAMATLLDGFQTFEPITVLQADTAAAIFTALMLSDLTTTSTAASPTTELAHPYDLFTDNAFDGGAWHLPYDMEGSTGVKVAIFLAGKLKSYPGTAGLKKELYSTDGSRVPHT